MGDNLIFSPVPLIGHNTARLGSRFSFLSFSVRLSAMNDDDDEASERKEKGLGN